MPREPKKSSAELAKWCERNEITIMQLHEDTALAYRTCHLAYHGFHIGYDSAKILSEYTGGRITVRELQDKPKRKQYPRR